MTAGRGTGRLRVDGAMRTIVVATAIALSARLALASGGDPAPLRQFHEALRLHPDPSSEGRWRALSRSCIGLDVMPGSRPLFGAASEEGRPFELFRPHPGPIAAPGVAGALADPLAPLVDPVRNLLAAGQDDLGLRIDLYEALVFQAASDVLPGARSTVGASRFNLRVDSLLFRNPGEGMGRLTMQVRANGVWPDASDSMQASTGAVSDLDEIASGDSAALTRLAYSQSAFDDRVLVSIGKISANDYVLLNVFASDESTQFLAQPFDGNDVWPVAFQEHALGIGFVSQPADWCFVNGFVIDAASAGSAGLGLGFGQGVALAGEVGLLAEVGGLPARLSVAWCGTNAGAASLAGAPEVWGDAFGAVAQVLIEPKLALWAQWSASENDVASDATAEVALGTTIDDCFGRAGDGFGAAIAWSEPTDGSLGDQVLLESFYRFQVTGSLQISIDGQLLMPSASAGVDDPALIGSLRAVWRF